MSSLKALVLKHLKTLNSYGQNQTCAEPPAIATSQSCHYAKKLTNSWGQLENTVAWEIRLGTKNATFLPMELLLSKFLGVADIFPSGIASSACI